MAHAELCPVCKGSGRLLQYPQAGTTSPTGAECFCHGCGGRGWIEVRDEVKDEIKIEIHTPWYDTARYPYSAVSNEYDTTTLKEEK